jgi:hypothetical protein
VSERDLQGLESLAERSALAGLLLVTYYGAREDGKRVRALSEKLIDLNPYNPVLLAEISRQAYASKSIWIPMMCVPQLLVMATSARDNFQVAVATNYQQRMTGNLGYAQRAGEQAVRCSTRNPEAWLVMGGTYANEADFLRELRRRKGGDQPPSAAEREANERWMALILHATQVDPHCENAWYWLGQVAERLGNASLADRAFWRCLAVGREMPGIYWWGLRRYRSPHYLDRMKLAKIAALAAAASAEWPPEQRVRVALAVVRAGLPEMALRVIRTDAERAELQARVRRLSQPLSEPSA